MVGRLATSQDLYSVLNCSNAFTMLHQDRFISFLASNSFVILCALKLWSDKGQYVSKDSPQFAGFHSQELGAHPGVLLAKPLDSTSAYVYRQSGWRSLSKDQRYIALLNFPDLSGSSCYSWPLVSLLGPSHSVFLVLLVLVVFSLQSSVFICIMQHHRIWFYSHSFGVGKCLINPDFILFLILIHLNSSLIIDPAAIGRLHLYLEPWDLSKFSREDPQQFKGQRRCSAGSHWNCQMFIPMDS